MKKAVYITETKTANTSDKLADDLKTDLTNTDETLSTKKKTSLVLQNISAAQHTPSTTLQSHHYLDLMTNERVFVELRSNISLAWRTPLPPTA